MKRGVALGSVVAVAAALAAVVFVRTLARSQGPSHVYATPPARSAYQWWHTCYSMPSGIVEVPTAVGNGAQRIFLMRAQQTAVTVLSGRYNDFSANPPERLLLDSILPALHPGTSSACPS